MRRSMESQREHSHGTGQATNKLEVALPNKGTRGMGCWPQGREDMAALFWGGWGEAEHHPSELCASPGKKPPHQQKLPQLVRTPVRFGVPYHLQAASKAVPAIPAMFPLQHIIVIRVGRIRGRTCPRIKVPKCWSRRRTGSADYPLSPTQGSVCGRE